MGKRLEEIEKWAKKCGCSQCKEKLFLLSEIHRLRGAIEKHKKKSEIWEISGQTQPMFCQKDRELYEI